MTTSELPQELLSYTGLTVNHAISLEGYTGGGNIFTLQIPYLAENYLGNPFG